MKIIFKTLFGSHLYGTDTPSSDKDYKSIFIQPIEDIVLGKKMDNVQQNTNSSNSRNTKEDVDTEYIELRKFIKDLLDGQTYALDMVFAPKEFWLESSPLWESVLDNRDKFLSKNIEPYMGYCRRQAGKYGLKGSRLGEVLRVIEFLETKDQKQALGEALKDFEGSEFAKVLLDVEQKNGAKTSFFEVLGKKYDFKIFVKDALTALNALKTRYGERAELAQKNEGVDWKAVSHAFRCCYQLIELAETQYIQFPLKEAGRIKEIKLGTLDYLPLQEELWELMNKAIESIEASSLSTNPDRKFWDNFILKTYLK